MVMSRVGRGSKVWIEEITRRGESEAGDSVRAQVA